MELAKFSDYQALDVEIRANRTAARKARKHRRALITAARRLKGQGTNVDSIKACVSLARTMGRIERRATWLQRSAHCLYYARPYEYYFGSYPDYINDI